MISVISKGEQHAFWQTCRKGCQDAADEYGAELYYYGPPSESDIVLQVEALNGEIQKQPSAICLAATSTGADLAEGGIYSDLLVCGFDAGATQKNAIREGWFFGSVTQDPYHIGYYAVEMAIKATRGEEVADKDTGAKWYNAENIDTPEIAELVYD